MKRALELTTTNEWCFNDLPEEVQKIIFCQLGVKTQLLSAWRVSKAWRAGVRAVVTTLEDDSWTNPNHIQARILCFPLSHCSLDSFIAFPPRHDRYWTPELEAHWESFNAEQCETALVRLRSQAILQAYPALRTFRWCHRPENPLLRLRVDHAGSTSYVPLQPELSVARLVLLHGWYDRLTTLELQGHYAVREGLHITPPPVHLDHSAFLLDTLGHSELPEPSGLLTRLPPNLRRLCLRHCSIVPFALFSTALLETLELQSTCDPRYLYDCYDWFTDHPPVPRKVLPTTLRHLSYDYHAARFKIEHWADLAADSVVSVMWGFGPGLPRRHTRTAAGWRKMLEPGAEPLPDGLIL